MLNIANIQMKSFINELVLYLKKPTEKIRSKNRDVSSDLKNLLILDIFLMLLTMPLAQILAYFELIDFSNHAASNLFRGTNLIFTLVYISIIIPVIEEFIFRFPLKLDYNLFPMIKLMRARSLSDEDERIKIFEVQRKWLKKYPFTFYGMSVLFALLHLNNFPLSVGLLIFAPLLCLPQFILGVLASYARLKYGLKYAMLLHGLHNFIFGLLAALSMS